LSHPGKAEQFTQVTLAPLVQLNHDVDVRVFNWRSDIARIRLAVIVAGASRNRDGAGRVEVERWRRFGGA